MQSLYNDELYNDEIIKLKDKKLQLAYILGGIKTGDNNPYCRRFWCCDIRCPCTSVENDERLEKVRSFIERHNISNETFLRLALTYLRGYIYPYKGDLGNLISELDNAILDYNFRHSAKFQENALKEKKLIKLVERESEVEGTQLNNLLTKYSLTPVDFMVLAKTSLNYSYCVGHGFEIKDLPVDLKNLLREKGLHQSYEDVQKYQKKFNERMLSQNTSNEKKSISLIKGIQSKFKR